MQEIVIKREIRPSHKMELGRCPSEIDWQLIESETLCDEKCKFLCSAIMTGHNILMPEKRVKIHRNDPPWMIGRTEALDNLAPACFLLWE